MDTEEAAKNRSELMRRAQGGDETAYAALLQSVLPMLRGYFGRRMKPGDDLEDLVQQVLLRVHLYRATFSGRDSFDAWLFTIARNTMWDGLGERRKRDREAGLDAVTESLSPTQDISLAVKQALGRLSDEAREAVRLTKIEGLDIKEAAERVQVTESALKVRVHRAMKVLRRNLGMDDDE